MASKAEETLAGAGISPRFDPVRGTGLLGKSVTIQEEPEEIESPAFNNMLATDSPTLVGSRSPKLRRASIAGKKLSGRPSFNKEASINSLSRQISSLNLNASDVERDGSEIRMQEPSVLLSQVVMWLHEEKAKQAARAPNMPGNTDGASMAKPPKLSEEQQFRTDDAMALEKLERILSGFVVSAVNGVSTLGNVATPPTRRKSSIIRRSKRGLAAASSDTEYQDGDLLVPNVEAVLDNSKTMTNLAAQTDNDLTTVKAKDKEEWATFKNEVVRLTHTLRLKGWRRIPIERGMDIDVERLSGALTNAVYVVSPPKDLPEPSQSNDGTTTVGSKNPPAKLLLRIYGPQVEHLIDREGELAILRRLARKKIGPRLLGTFSNGRFEEFFNARTLTPEDLRIPETSKQIAKRMRELHDGIELLDEERDAGPFVWRNWDKWVNRCEQVTTWLDKQILEQQKTATDSKPAKRWMQRGFVCGVEWALFRRTVEKYRKHIEKTHGGKTGVKDQLVFAHNDTQYGNLMRLKPTGESPLLHPSNEHRQLIVIDFEYASANTPGIEFANHFTEWCYNYHHPDSSYACNTQAYPTLPEQHRFIRSYVMHRPQFNPAASATPKMTAKESSISGFMLDARAPQGEPGRSDYDAEEKAREEATEKQIEALMHETRIWRVANHAQWVAWGIVQAKVPELDDMPKVSRTAAILEKIKKHIHPQSDPLNPDVQALQDDAKRDRPEGREQEEAHGEGDEEDGEHEEEFDYLTYAQDRAMFFWGDCLQLGLVKEEELPESLRTRVKVVKY